MTKKNNDLATKALSLLSKSKKTNYQIAKDTGISEATLSNYTKGKSTPNPVNADILIKYITGKTDDNLPQLNNESIPLIPIEAMAGFGTGEAQVMLYDCERFVIPSFKGAEFLIAVKGSSMYPKYSSGDIVACKKLPLDTFFQWNKVYVLDTEQGALIKRIEPGIDDEHLLIVSENPKYKPFELHKSKINSVALVIGVLRLE